MDGFPKHLGKALGSGPNRIAWSTALRGTIATVAPLVLLPRLGLAALAYPAVIGALGTSMVDVGGPYRSRLAAMVFLAAAGPCLMLLGTRAVAAWWLAMLLMFVIAVAAGLIRALGRGSIALGINVAIAFLVGLQIGEIGGPASIWAVGYGGGALWTILVALAFWQLRPYRRLEQEAASAWEAVADLVAATQPPAPEASVVARRRREQRIAASHRAAREAVEQARDALGEMRAGMVGPGTTIAQLVVLLNAAARIGAATVALGEIEPAGGAERLAAGAELERQCRAAARILLDGRGGLAPAPLRQHLQEWAAQRPTESAPELLAFAQAMRHLDNAEEAIAVLFGQRHRLPHLLRLPFAHRRAPGSATTALRAHLTPRSAIFRHAMRVAVIAAIGTAAIARFRLPHGIWLPLTSLVILQPDYGSTQARALQRAGGTIAGAVLAGLLLASVRGTAAYDAALGVLLFATFFLIRRRYGLAITFLTPLIILLIGAGSADPWLDLADRIAYTLAGAGLALAAGYLLWPQWERAQLPERLAGAVRADRAYLGAVLDALSRATRPEPNVAALRRQAEIAAANADAAYQRMLAEPAHQRASVAKAFAALIYIHRLCRHTIALAAHLGELVAPAPELAALRRLVEASLDDAAEALAAARPAAPRPAFDAPLARLRAGLGEGGEEDAAGTAKRLLSQLVSDVTALGAAAGGR